MARGPVCPGEVRQWTAASAVFPRGTCLLVLYRAIRPGDDRTRVGLLAAGTCRVEVVSLEVAVSMATRLKDPPTREGARGVP